jgi:hypothetical protein
MYVHTCYVLYIYVYVCISKYTHTHTHTLTNTHTHTQGIIKKAESEKAKLQRLRTSTIYSQQKFNLLREECEGYSKLVVDLDKGFSVRIHICVIYVYNYMCVYIYTYM